jgi:ribosomal-protein-alanine N-acetyltransferase
LESASRFKKPYLFQTGVYSCPQNCPDPILTASASATLAGRGGLRKTAFAGNKEVEIAYGLLPGFWNRGLASEFACCLVSIGFGKLRVTSLVSITLPGNIASRRVLEKAGFSYEREVSHNNKVHVLYGM